MAVHGGSSIPLVLFSTTFPPILLSRPSMRQITSWSLFVVRFVLRSGHKLLTLLRRITITCFPRHILFCFPGSVCSSAKFLVHTHDFSFASPNLSFHAHLLFTGLDDDLCRLEQVEQRPSRAVLQLGNTSNTSGDESNLGVPRRRLWPKRTYKMKKVWGASDVGQFYVTGPTDVATKPSLFLPYLSQEALCAVAWSPRNFVVLPGQQTFSP